MKPPKVVFVCQECGAQSPKWMGKCVDCGAWNSFVEERLAAESSSAGSASTNRYAQFGGSSSAKLYADVETADANRLSSGIGEFDRVLGGGIVPGSLVLLGGEPGIGKSTLLLQAAAHFATGVGPVLYASGEESEHQIKSRGDRLGIGSAPLYLLAETCIERILEEIARLKPWMRRGCSNTRPQACSIIRCSTGTRASSATSPRHPRRSACSGICSPQP